MKPRKMSGSTLLMRRQVEMLVYLILADLIPVIKRFYEKQPTLRANNAPVSVLRASER